jgi:hypothetical protein
MAPRVAGSTPSTKNAVVLPITTVDEVERTRASHLRGKPL